MARWTRGREARSFALAEVESRVRTRIEVNWVSAERALTIGTPWAPAPPMRTTVFSVVIVGVGVD